MTSSRFALSGAGLGGHLGVGGWWRLGCRRVRLPMIRPVIVAGAVKRGAVVDHAQGLGAHLLEFLEGESQAPAAGVVTRSHKDDALHLGGEHRGIGGCQDGGLSHSTMSPRVARACITWDTDGMW